MEKEPIGKLISLISRKNQKYLSKALKAYQLGSGGQHSFLKAIISHPGVNQDQLTVDLKFDKATTARSVKQLEEAGYIVRKVDEKDRRSHRLYPTQKGLSFGPTLQTILEAANERLTSSLSEVERDQLISLLQKIDGSSYGE